MKIFKRIVVFLFFIFFSAQVYASEDKALFWKVKSNSATVYMLGSIHYADKSFYPLRAEIEKAFELSDSLVVEVDMSAESSFNYNDLIAREGTYSGDETIKDHISDKTYQALTIYLKKLGIPPELVQKQKPGILVLTLTAVHVMQLGLDPSLGIDLHFLSSARGSKKILSLETTEEQLRIFLDLPNGDLVLRESLHSMKDAGDLLDEIVAAWKKGDEEKMRKLLIDDALDEYPEFASIYDRLLYQRNIKMAKSINKYLTNEGTYFVVVGAGHFLGERGIPRLLENAGYKVERR